MNGIVRPLLISLTLHGLIMSSAVVFHRNNEDLKAPDSFISVSIESMGQTGHSPETPMSQLRKHTSCPETSSETRVEKPGATSPMPLTQITNGHAGTDERESDELTGDQDVDGHENSGSNSSQNGDSSETLHDVSSTIQKAYPLYSHNPPPVYPRSALIRALEGTVELSVMVDKQGNVKDLCLKKSSGYSVLDQAAMDSVRRWVFEPGKIGGRQTEMWVIVPMIFRIKQA